jgi:hypothetical protein
MPRSFAADQQLGQHRPTAPDTCANVTLPGQNPQQTQQLQIRRAGSVRQGHGQRQ